MEEFKDRYEQIVRRTKEDLAAYEAPEKVSFAERLRRLFGKKRPEKDLVNWPAGMLLLGLWEAGEDEAVRAYIDRWIEKGMPLQRADDALAGYVILGLYGMYGEERYRTAAEKIHEMLAAAPKDAEGGIIYNPAAGNDAVFADGTGMAVMFLAKYGMLFRDAQALTAARQMLAAYRLHGMEENTGLPWHGYVLRDDRQCGLAGWGRAVGWILMGVSVYLQETAQLPDAEIAAYYRGLCDAAEAFRQESGLVPWHLAKDETKTDTSATAMIEYAMLLGGYRGADADNSAAVFQALWDSAPEGEVGGALAECLDFGNHPQKYGHYPWGQGAALAALSLFRRLQLRGGESR